MTVTSEAIAEMRQIAMEDSLCPGCAHALEQHHPDRGCDERDRSLVPASSAICPCLLDVDIIADIFMRWNDRAARSR